MHILSTLSIWFWLAWAVLTVGPGLTSVLILVRCLRLLKTDREKYAQVPVEDWVLLQELLRCTRQGAAENKGLALMTPDERLALGKLAAASSDGYGLVKVDEYQRVAGVVQSAPWVDARKYAEDRAEVERVKRIAQQAYDVCIGMIPDSAISASKVGGEVVTTGFPDLDPAAFVKK